MGAWLSFPRRSKKEKMISVRPFGRHLWRISAPYYSQVLRDCAKAVPGIRWEGAEKCWVGYVDAVDAVARALEAKDAPVNRNTLPKGGDAPFDASLPCLPVSYEGLRDYQKVGVDFLVCNGASGVLLADDMGCVDGESIVSINRAAVTRKVTIAWLYNNLATRKTGDYAVTRIRSLCGDTFRLNDVIRVLDKGIKPVLRIKLTSGKTIRVTPDHEFVTPHGDCRADALVRGQAVWVNGGKVVFIPKEDRVSSVRADGETHVYDIVCADPHRNFVANGIVVHNCGKSAQALRAARAFRNKTVIVCPSYVRGVWGNPQGQIEKWWPDAYPHTVVLGGTRPTPLTDETQVVIIHYDVVHAWVDTLIALGVRTFIGDEGHLLQNPKSRRSIACRAIARVCVIRMILTGTPMQNRPKDLWNVIDILSEGRMGANFFNFGIVFCNGHKEQVTPEKIVWDFKGVSNADELRTRMKFFMLRRTKADVALEIPPKTRQIIDVEVTKRHRYDVSLELLKSTSALRRALNVAADGKLKEAASLVRDYSEGHKVVVFTYRKSVAEFIVNSMTAARVKSAFIHGDVPQKKRDAIIVDAQQCKTDHVLAATIDSTSTGIDLSYADVCVFVELTWEPHKLAQAEARLHRFGQTRPVLIVYLIARGTGDELILQTVISKLETFENIIGSTGDLKSDLDSAPKGQDALDALYEAVVARQAVLEAAQIKIQKKKKVKS
jgi:hypothetical protein